MIAHIEPATLSGRIDAIPSKSAAHRLLICAAFADRETYLKIGSTSEDIDATIRCLRAFGTEIRHESGGLRILPGKTVSQCTADCGESGSTLRFLLPVAAALGIDASFQMHGRLPNRPIFPLDRELQSGGCRLSRPKPDILRIEGKLKSGLYTLPGNVSSQYISGMLFALTLADGESTLEITDKIESKAYIELTLAAMRCFGAEPERTESGFRTVGRPFVSPEKIVVEGDWSNAAFWFCAEKIGGKRIDIHGLDPLSTQGDRRICAEIDAMEHSAEECIIDAADIPDLVPALAAYAALKNGKTRFIHAERLRIKESDRLSTVASTLNALGGCVQETADGLIVCGKEFLSGGCVSANGDHRIAMMTAIASIGCKNSVEIRSAEAVSKSYPNFWRDFNALGGRATLMEE